MARKLQRFSFSSNTVPGEQLRTVAIQEPDLAPAWHDTHLKIFLINVLYFVNIFSVNYSPFTVCGVGGRVRAFPRGVVAEAHEVLGSVDHLANQR